MIILEFVFSSLVHYFGSIFLLLALAVFIFIVSYSLDPIKFRSTNYKNGKGKK